MATTSSSRAEKAERERAQERSAAQDENQGLAARLVDLRRALDEQRKHHEREQSALRQVVAQLEQQVAATIGRVDTMTLDFERRSRDLETAQREAGEQVRAAGELARKMSDHMRVLDELREVAADPHEVVKPIRRDIGELRHELTLLAKQVDHRFEQLPRARQDGGESRGDHALDGVRADIKRLFELVKNL